MHFFTSFKRTVIYLGLSISLFSTNPKPHASRPQPRIKNANREKKQKKLLIRSVTGLTTFMIISGGGYYFYTRKNNLGEGYSDDDNRFNNDSQNTDDENPSPFQQATQPENRPKEEIKSQNTDNDLFKTILQKQYPLSPKDSLSQDPTVPYAKPISFNKLKKHLDEAGKMLTKSSYKFNGE
ncbi:MAG: hypothetical protein AAF335_02900 [Bacteroidota bacterium]